MSSTLLITLVVMLAQQGPTIHQTLTLAGLDVSHARFQNELCGRKDVATDLNVRFTKLVRTSAQNPAAVLREVESDRRMHFEGLSNRCDESARVAATEEAEGALQRVRAVVGQR